MKIRLLIAFGLLAMVAILGNFFLASKEEKPASTAKTVTVTKSLPTKSRPTPAPHPDAPTFHTLHRGEQREFILALDEAIERLPDGKDRTIDLDPPATSETLSIRLANLKSKNPVFPVCYQKGEERNLYTRRIVTRDLTIELSHKNTVPDLPPGVTLKERPVYAPNHAVVSAADPFAALAALNELQVTPGIAEAEVQLAVQRSKKALPNDPLISRQWHVKASGLAAAGSDINIEDAWLYGGTGGVRGTGIRIGIVDDGLQTAHPDLAANVDTINDRDWNGNDNSPEPGFGDNHGTACAGNAGAVGNNNLGVAGTAPESTLVGMRLIAAAASDSQEAQAMFYLPDLIEIKSNSWGPFDSGVIDEPGTLTRAALASAAASGRNGKGSILVWAGGNGLESSDNSNYDGYANDIHTIAVGATNSRGQQSYYSESGANLVVVGPSSGRITPTGITTTDLTGTNGYNDTSDYTDDFGGTSSSTPTVAGIIALLLEKNPNLGWRDVQEILITSARKNHSFDSDWSTNAAGLDFNHKYGSGLADATAAVNLADGWENLEDAISDSESASNLNLPIPDNNTTGVSHELTLDGPNIRCEQVTLEVTATHTFRGDLAITLTSPSGMVSQLAETRGTDQGNNYSGFTFSTVRHWGEDSNGTWTVKVNDGASVDTGTLTALTLTAHGAPVAPRNPGPEVAITSPADNSAFSPGATVNVNITATDLTIDGSTGIVSSVELFDGNTSLGIDTSFPYNFTLNPPLGIYNLTVVATDSEGESTTSSTASFVVADQIPVITSASLTPASQAFADEALTVTGVAGIDPEGSPLTYKYAWENSSDGLIWNSTSISGATLPASPANAGFLWRVQVRANDGVSDSLPFTTGSTNSLTRPPSFAMIGESIAYDSGLVLRGSGSTLTREAIINEFSQGSAGTSEWIELLILQETSLRNWKLSDTNFSNPLNFSDVPAWDDIPAGTILVIYNGSSKDPLLPPNDSDPSDYSLVVASNNSGLFNGNWPAFGNGGDAVILRDSAGSNIMRFSYGGRTSPTPNLGSAGSGESLYYTGSSETDAILPEFWTTTSSTVARSLREPRIPTSLPIIFGGDWTSLPTGLTSSGTGFYSSSLGGDTEPGSARFDTSGDQLTVEFNAPSGIMSYQIRGNSGGQPNTTGTFVIEESADGSSYLPLRVLTDIGTTDTAYSDTPTGSTRFIRFRYEQKIAGNIQLDKLAITAGGAEGNESLSLTIAPNIISEDAGIMASTGTLIIEETLSSDLVVSLISSNPAGISVPATATIPAGELTATFPLEAINNNTSDGDQSVVIEASATGFTTSNFKITLVDDDEDLIGVTPGAGNNLNNQGFVENLRAGLFNGPALYRLAAGSTLPDGLTLDTFTGQISGTVDDAATVASYPVTIERYNDFPEATSLTFNLNVITESNFATWIAGQGVTGIAATDDPDGDGLVNLLEYYLDGNAGTANTGIAPTLLIAAGETKLGFWHLKTATDVTGIVEWSNTLEDGSWSTSGVSSQVTIDEPTREYLEVTIPSGATKRFVRLRVE